MKNPKRTSVRILLGAFIIIGAYLGYMLLGGGFGRKPVTLETFYDNNIPLLFAHRGVVLEFPENSREAVEQAKNLGFKGLEVDIRKSSDNEFILFHDEDCQRLLGLNNRIDEMSTAQIKEYRLRKNDLETASSVMTLEELLDGFKGDFIFYFDLKLKNCGDADELAEIIRDHGLAQSSIIASASISVIFHLEHKYPEINTALEGFNAGKEWIYYFMPKNLKPDFYSGFADKVNEEHVEWLQKKDLLSSRIVYGVDSTNYQEMTELGLRNLIIDYYPGLQIP